jgi:hypothetical protein
MKKEKFLVYMSGDGRLNYQEKGSFEVRYGTNDIKEFTSLKEACEFYDSLFCEKALWQIGYYSTYKQIIVFRPELIEHHQIIKKAPTNTADAYANFQTPNS